MSDTTEMLKPTIQWRFVPSRKRNEDGELHLMGMSDGWCLVRSVGAVAPFVMSQAAWEALDDVKA